MIRGHMGETALHGNIAPPFLPRRGHSTRVHSVHRQTWAQKPLNAQALFVPLAVNGTKVVSAQVSPRTNPSSFLTDLRRDGQF